MFTTKLYFITLMAIISVLSVQAQNNPAATTCQTATGMQNINATLLAGNWYEEIRAPAKNVSCVQVLVNIISNQTQLSIKTMYSASQAGMLMDQIAQVVVNVSVVNANTGFNISNINANGVNTTYKILSTDYKSNLVLCGFTNANNPNTSYAAVFSRTPVLSGSVLMSLKSNASQIYAGFNDNSTGNITQSTHCSPNSATANSVPMLAILFTTFYALLKFVH